jgi:hypothetical protein
MKAAKRLAIWTTAIILAIPALALPQNRYRPMENKALAYRAGYQDGYRDGLRQGGNDYRTGRKYNYRTREYKRAGDNYRSGFRDLNEFRKGYQEGFRMGYNNAYRGIYRGRRWLY